MNSSNTRGLIMMPGNVNMLGMIPRTQELPMEHLSSDIRNRSSQPIASTEQPKAEVPRTRGGCGRRGKIRSPGGTVKTENIKGDVEVLAVHTEVQAKFAAHLANLLKDSDARDLQCCVTYGKPCGCIRKYILAGVNWKESSAPSLRIGFMKDKDCNAIAASDQASIHQEELIRAQELLDILHRAAELKKEKCYVTSSEGVDGKPLKELRGMIGLGNGRKRSKKYEDYVLEKRGKLREEYFLCEKAAQKLLGYSINFLYKKLRTNPQKTSRLVATNKAERASKVPRHLIPLNQLREMANNQQSTNQCCCRNCISWLVKQHFNKIVDWRRRLEGSGQRVAQEIVAEVLLASASLDGQNSFCQNLVHWVTGCSFKKIRRVRDHLKKDPKSLPEHGLKRYWKDKARNQAKSRGDSYKSIVAKTEKDADGYSNTQGIERFPAQYSSRMSGGASDSLNGEGSSQISNLNNSNNRFGNQAQYIPASSPNPPPNQTLPSVGMGNVFDGVLNNAYSRENTSVYQQLQRPPQESTNAHQMYVTPQPQSNNMLVASGMNIAPSNYGASTNTMPQTFNLAMQNAAQPNETFSDTPVVNYNNHSSQQNYNSKSLVTLNRPPVLTHQQHITPQSNTITQTRPQHEPDPVQYGDQQPIQQVNYAQPPRSKEDQAKFHSAPFIGFADPNNNVEGGPPSYYFATSAGNPQQDGFFHTGMTPLFLAHAQQPEGNQNDQDHNFSSQFSGQSFFLLSPALPNAEKHGNLNPGDLENWKQMVMPITPIQMYPASYFQNGQGDNSDGKNIQTWGTDAQHFMFPVGDTNMAFNQNTDHGPHYADQQGLQSDSNKRQQGFVQGNQPQTYFQPSLTPLAVMQPQGNNLFSNVGWFAAQPAVPTQQPIATDQAKKPDVNSCQYLTMDDPNCPKYYENQPVEQTQGNNYMAKDNQFYSVDKSQPSQQLPMMSQWATINQNQSFSEALQPTNQWPSSQNEAQDQKPQFVSQLPPTQHTSTVSQNNLAAQPQTSNSKVLIRNQMPPLAPLPGINSKLLNGNVDDQKSSEVPHALDTSSNMENAKSLETHSPKGAPISNRSKRFSRDRLRATIDSPCLIPPMTPLTPAMTPTVITQVNVAGAEMPEVSNDGNASASSSNSQTLDSSVFRFPPTHVSRRVAALRMQGHTTDIHKDDKTNSSRISNEQKQADLATVITQEGDPKNNKEKAVASDAVSDSRNKSPSSFNVTDSVSTKDLTGALGSSESLGYMSESFLQSDNTLLVDLTNVKTLPVLSIPSAGWSADDVAVKASTSEANTDLQLQTPTQVLNTPTHQLTPSVTQLHTPNQQLLTPNQGLNTPTQPLNTPTQPLNTPTDLNSPSQSSDHHHNDEESPVKVLMPAPAGKKRKAEANDANEKMTNQKQMRFHNFTPKDFENGHVNVSAFRKPSEYVSGSVTVVESTSAKRPRKSRKQTNPQVQNNSIIEIQDHDTDKSDISVDEDAADKTISDTVQSPEKETNAFHAAKSTSETSTNPQNVMFITNPLSLPTLKTPSVLQRITPVFSVPATSPEDAPSSSTGQSQLNTPVLLHSGTIVTPSTKLNSALLRRTSPNPAGSSTPQFFTFVSGTGFPTPMFFTPPSESSDKSKSNRPKSVDANNTNSSEEKLKSSPIKRGPMTLNITNKPLPDDALQTPSKLQVVTPSAVFNNSGLVPDVPQIFCFQELPLNKQIASGLDKSRSSEPAVSAKATEQQNPVQNKTSDSAEESQAAAQKAAEPNNSSAEVQVKPTEAKRQLRLPSLVVDPPSDGDENNETFRPTTSKNDQTSTAANNKNQAEDQPTTSSRPTLHRTRSGSKTDLLLPLHTTNSPQKSDQSETVAPSPLNTPSGIQVVTPTMAAVLSASKLPSQLQRFPTGVRVRPQSLMMAPICLNPGNPPTSQVATPTLFHIISPSHTAPPSPSVVLYPYLPRGLVKGSGPLSCGSVSNSPAFGIIRPSASSGSNSASLLKSALIKKLPVFQFPPSIPTTTPTSESAPPLEKGADKSNEKPHSPENRTQLNSAPDSSSKATSSNSSASEERPSSAEELSDKLSGPNDPCLSEAAQD